MRIPGLFVFLLGLACKPLSAADPDPVVITNSLGMKLVRIEKGEFLMGSPETEEGHSPVEKQHRVRITKPFYLGQHEVTYGAFRKFVAETGHKSVLERDGKPGFGFLPDERIIEILPKFRWNNTGWEQTDRHAVTNLGWDDAVAFCQWLSKKEGHEYRLPTEAEWEYACRAGTTTRYSTGEEETSLRDFANLADASFLRKYINATWSIEWDDQHSFAAPVGSFRPNRWGLHDMHGNVWEWCGDWYGADYFEKSPVDDPTGPATGERRMLRGGAFTNRSRFVRSADRDCERPKYRYNFTGFRVARTIPLPEQTELRGEIIDEATRQPVAARLMIQGSDGKSFFAMSTAEGGAVTYDRARPPRSVERHTALVAKPFVASLPPGKYTLTVERGKEYLPLVREIEIGFAPRSVTLELKRWNNAAERGWFSGDTHVHRPLAELPTPMLADDVNVVLPMTRWVTASHTAPAQGNRSPDKQLPTGLIRVDDTHVIHPLNTEYEIFSVRGKQHTLGAVLIVNQQSELPLGVPTVKPIAAEARRQGALLDLEKHSWPWSLMLVPVMNVDLFELANNHLWRTDFAFGQWTLDTKLTHAPIETDAGGFTEWGWANFGFETYYTLLNCGFRLRPTAGTAAGVHPVSLGFGRVYVQTPDRFSYDAWMSGLKAGRSFVTTGPLLFVTYNDQPPGTTFSERPSCHVAGTAESAEPLDRIEVLVNGEIRHTLSPANRATPAGGFVSPIDVRITLDGSAWVVVRCFEKRPDGRLRFAHGSPVFFDVPDRPVKPRPGEVSYLVRRMEQELVRNAELLQPEELAEFREALDRFRKLEPR